MNNMDGVDKRLEQLRSIANAPEDDHPLSSFSDSINKQAATAIVKAAGRLGRDNRADLLSRPEPEMLFLARAIIESPRTAYSVLLANYRILLQEEAAKRPSIRKGKLVDAVYDTLTRLGFGRIMKNKIVCMDVEECKAVQVTVPAGFKMNALTDFKRAMMQQYDFRGALPEVTQRPTGDPRTVNLIFSVKAEKGLT